MKRWLLGLAACGGSTEQPPAPDAITGAHLTATVTGPTSLANRTTQDFTVVLGNDGDTATGDIGASVDGLGFTIAGNACTVLAPGASCVVSIAFAPRSEGDAASTLSAIAAPGGTVTAALAATVTQGNDLSIAPGGFAFPDTAVGTTATQSGMVTNIGVHALGPVAITVADPRFAITTSCAMLAAGASCGYQVSFSPMTTAGNTVTSIAATAPPLGMAFTKAEGYGATLIAAPVEVPFPATPVGSTTVPTAIAITNSQAFPIGPIAIDASALGAFAIADDTCATGTLSPGAHCVIQVTFMPTVAGAAVGAITATAPDEGTLHNAVTIILEGSGT